MQTDKPKHRPNLRMPSKTIHFGASKPIKMWLIEKLVYFYLLPATIAIYIISVVITGKM